MLFQLGQLVLGTEHGNTQGRFKGRQQFTLCHGQPLALLSPRQDGSMATAAAQTPVLTVTRASPLGEEETKAPKEAMGEPPQAVVVKTFGGLDETCEVRSPSYYPSGLLPLPEKKVQSENILISSQKAKLQCLLLVVGKT